MARLRLQGISRPSAIIMAHRESQQRSKSIQKRKRSVSPKKSPRNGHIKRAQTMRTSKKHKHRLVEIPRSTLSLQNSVKDRLSLKKGLQLADDLNLKLASKPLSVNMVVRVIAPTQPRGPLSRVNGMVGKVVGFKEKSGHDLVNISINIDGRTAKYHVPYTYIRLINS